MQVTKSLALLLGVAFCNAQFASPSAGDVLQINQQIQIQWQTQGLQAPININLVPSDVTDLTVIAQQVAVQIDNVGSIGWTPDISIAAFQSFTLIITDSAQITIISESFQISQLTEQPVVKTITKPFVQDFVATRPNGEVVTSVLTTFGAAVVTAPAGPIKVFYSGSETPQAFVQTPVGLAGAGVVGAVATPTASAAGQVGVVSEGPQQLRPLPGFADNSVPQSLIPLPGFQAPQGSLRPLPGAADPPTAVAAGEVVLQTLSALPTAVAAGEVIFQTTSTQPTAVAAGEVIFQTTSTQPTAVAGGEVIIETTSTQPTAVAAGEVVIQTATPPAIAPIQGGFQTLVPPGTPSAVAGDSLSTTTPTAVAAGQVAIQTASLGSLTPIAATISGVAAGTGIGLRPLPLAPLATPVASFASAGGVVAAPSSLPLANGPNRFSNGTSVGASAAGIVISGVAGATGAPQLQPLPGAPNSGNGQGPLQALPGNNSPNSQGSGETGSLQPLSGSDTQATGSASLRPLGAPTGAATLATSIIPSSGLGGVPGAAIPSNGGLSAQTTPGNLSAGYRISSKGGLTALVGAVATLLITFTL